MVISKIKINKFFLYLFLFTSPFINFSFIPHSNLPMSYLVMFTYCLACILIPFNWNRYQLRSYDYLFICFLILMIFSVMINTINGFHLVSVTQMINFIFIYLIFKTTQNSYALSNEDLDKTLTNWFKFNSYLCVSSLIFFCIGLVYEPFVRAIFDFFNNSGNFSKGGLTASFSETNGARLNSLSPEPSFWGFFTAFNFALGLSLKRKNYLLLGVTFLNLILSLSRTGYLMFVVLIFVLIWKKLNMFFKILAIIAVVLIFTTYLSGLNVHDLLEVDDSFKQRFGSLFTAYKLTMENPIIGIGIGNFQFYAKAMGLDYGDVFSLFFYILVSGGVTSLIFFIWFCTSIHKNLKPAHKVIWIVALVGWGTVAAYNLPYIWVFLGIVVAAFKRKQNNIGSSVTNL